MEVIIQYSTEDIMRQALQKIANPIAYLQQEAKEQGGQLDGMALGLIITTICTMLVIGVVLWCKCR